MLSPSPGAGLWGPPLSGGWHGGGISPLGDLKGGNTSVCVCWGLGRVGWSVFRRLSLFCCKTGVRGWGAVLECPLRFSQDPLALD